MTSDIIIRAKNGDAESIEKILDGIMPYIGYLNKMFYIKGADCDDLYQECRISAYSAILNYSFDSNVSFTDFLRTCIRRRLYTQIKHSNRNKNIFFYNAMKNNVQERGDKANIGMSQVHTIDICHSNESLAIDSIIRNSTKVDFYSYLKDVLTCIEYQVCYYKIEHKMTFAEIAAKTGYSDKAVDNAWGRVKKKVLRILHDDKYCNKNSRSRFALRNLLKDCM